MAPTCASGRGPNAGTCLRGLYDLGPASTTWLAASVVLFNVLLASLNFLSLVCWAQRGEHVARSGRECAGKAVPPFAGERQVAAVARDASSLQRWWLGATPESIEARACSR
jgi:hypothetical protein